MQFALTFMKWQFPWAMSNQSYGTKSTMYWEYQKKNNLWKLNRQKKDKTGHLPKETPLSIIHPHVAYMDQSHPIIHNYAWESYLIQNEVLPLLPPESLMILNHQLVRCDAHMECIGFGPTLKHTSTTKGNRQQPAPAPLEKGSPFHCLATWYIVRMQMYQTK